MLAPTQENVRFGLFELDTRVLQLTRNGSTIRLPQQPLRLLSVLLESPGEIVTREQLRQRLWPSDVFVDFDHGLNKSIQKLRDALGDSAGSPRYIETIPRVGYRFIAPIHFPEAATLADPGVTLTSPPAVPATLPSSPATPHSSRRTLAIGVGVALAVVAAIAIYVHDRSRPSTPTYTQLTSFTDSAMAPALSPDGHILAFIRGNSSFLANGQIYVQILPDGEPRQITNDPRNKYGLAFSPDGSEIAYTVLDPTSFTTYAVPVLGGTPRVLLQNAAGLTWLDSQHYLFSRIRSGLHLGVETQSVSGADLREIYFPPHERAMAHYSYASPDRRKALVVEMDAQGDWSMCRLISLVGDSSPQPIGPNGACTAAGWSPDGTWMYFIANVQGQSHIWRQRSSSDSPEQVTFGPFEEDGLAVEPDHNSLITSSGEHQSSIWIHDADGERSLSSEGEVLDRTPSTPSFAPGDQFLYYLSRRQAGDSPELFRLTLSTGQAESVFPGVFMDAYNLSPDGRQVIYSSSDSSGHHLWIAPVDRTAPPRRVGPDGASSPLFGPNGKILFLVTEGNTSYLEQTDQNGSARTRVVPFPVLEIQGISPQRNWILAVAPRPDHNAIFPMELAIPLNGGPPVRLCAQYCVSAWSSDGKTLYVPIDEASRDNPGKSLAIPLGPGEALPPLPPGGIPHLAQPDSIPGARLFDRAHLIPGSDPARYIYIDTTVHRNLYRVTLP